MKRVATGLLLGFLFIFLILYATLFWLSVIVSLTVGLALFEYYRIVVSRDRGLLWLGTLLGATVPIIIFLFGLKGFSGYLIFTVFFIFTYCLFTHKGLAPDGIIRGQASVTSRSDAPIRSAPHPKASERIGAGVLGIVYIAFSLSHLILLRNLEQGRMWLLFLVFIISANDTCAYYAGRGIGRHKLAPVVSPQKTVEGAFGGLTGGVLAALVFQQFFLPQILLQQTVALAILIGILSQASDLFESLIKRSAGVKDSGNILPGHGGALDRIDSLIFPIPFLYYYLVIFK